MDRIGFIGTGTMGHPMAANLIAAGTPLTVWNRTPERVADLVARGAVVASDAADLIRECSTVIVMLFDESAIDDVLRRSEPGWADAWSGRTLILMSTVQPAYSEGLRDEIEAAGGVYLEAPVSGSRVPAERGELVVMLSGTDDDAMTRAELLMRPLSRRVVRCGPTPGALRTKLAVNLYMIVLVTGLVEAVGFARADGVDIDAFAQVLEAGPMDNALARIKLAKMIAGDISPQAAIHDVAKNARFIVDEATRAGAPAPLISLARGLFDTTAALGLADADMVAVAVAIARAGIERD
jgi:3-hydroxyisobutyrate dehydrogenase